MKHLPRTLSLTSPYMKGSDVLAVQKRLGAVKDRDGVYGPVTAGAVRDWKYRVGFPMKFVNNRTTASDWRYLSGQWKLTPAMRLRARRRKASAPHPKAPDIALKEFQRWAGARYVERPASSNIVPELKAKGRSMGVRPYYYNMGYPWCAYSAMLAALHAGSKTAKQGLVQGRFNPLYVPEIYNLATRGQYGMRVVSWAEARPGDFVIFNWDGGVPDHIGMLISKYSNSARTVEGNTSAGAGGSQSNGGGCFVRDRSRHTIQAFVRWS